MDTLWGNATNSGFIGNFSQPIPSVYITWTVSFLYLILSIFAIVLHILVAIAVFSAIKIKEFNSFHILTLNLYFADTLTFVVYAFYSSPCLMIRGQIYGQMGAKILGAIQTVDFIASIFLTFFISVNRGLALGDNKWNKVIFRKRNCLFFVLLAWILGALTVIWNYELSCLTVFDEMALNFRAVCASGLVPSVFSPTSIAIYLGAYGVGVFYVYAAYALWKRHHVIEAELLRVAAKNRRTRLLYQAFFIWLSLLANVLGK